ncbi:MAG TPA: right-handed parallel beta-helix repeat-containing protein [Desulfobulbus sp.]|nr:right-handed parallel beta-helix repeat-containing protein [Desulfobulbus sp.]
MERTRSYHRSCLLHLLCTLVLLATFFPCPAVQAGKAVSPGTWTRYRAVEIPADRLAREKPVFPDLAGYTVAAVETRIGTGPEAGITLERMRRQPMLEDFTAGRSERIREWAMRQRSFPRAIFIRNGHATPALLAARLGPDLFAESEPGVFTCRLPLVVGPDATLIVDDRVRELRLSRQRGAFLVNGGRLFLVRTRVTGWDEENNGPAAYRSEHDFRPFIIAWGDSETYIAASRIASLGYHQSKSYGITLSQYNRDDGSALHRRPSGWIIDSEFTDIYYGFYCYEADDVVILRNDYHDNIVYGIDPHDRSRRLIIAGNRVWGSKKKHGIVISRDVNDSWIFDNRSFDNGLSGILLDRNCTGNMVAGNVIYGNRGDGISVYESDHNTLWGNVIMDNHRNGIMLRNSVNLAIYDNLVLRNFRYGVAGMVRELSGTGRDLVRDPHFQKLSFVLYGGVLADNRQGPLKIDNPLRATLCRVRMLFPRSRDGIRFTGPLLTWQERIFALLARGRAVVVEPEPVAAPGRSLPGT